MLSAKPIHLQAADALLSAQAVQEVQTISVLAGSDGPSASAPPLNQPSAAGDQNGQDPLLQGIGQNLLGNDLSAGNNVGLLSSDANQGSGGPLLGIGNIPPNLQNSGLNSLSTGQANLLLNQGDSANPVVSSGADDLLLEGGVFLGTNSGNSNLRSTGITITATPVILVNTLSAPGSQTEVDSAGQNPAPAGSDSQPQAIQEWESSNQALIRWLSSSWTEPALESRIAETPAYAPSGIVQNVSPAMPLSSPAAQRLISVGAGINADHGPQVSAYAVGVTGEAYSAALTGRDNEWIEKPGNGTGTFAKAALVSGTIDTPAAAAKEASSDDPILSFALTALGGEPPTRQAYANPDMEHTQDAAANPVGPRHVNPSAGELFLSLQMVDSASRFGLLQIDVATGAPVTNDSSMRESSSSTAAYLGGEQSTIWSILTTYSLVILPRQRKPQLTILVVDPDDVTRDAVNVALVRAGYFVLPAASVRDAWGMLRTPHARIDLVLMDPHLPDVSGIHLCARLREISPTVPVMVCAGDVEPAEVDQLRQLGVRYYLRKPIAFEELLHTVRAILT